MPGQFEGLQNLIGRLESLKGELARATDPVQRRQIRDRIEQVDGEIDEWWKETKRDADAGDLEAQTILKVVRDLDDEESP